METAPKPKLLSQILADKALLANFINRQGFTTVTVGSFAPVHLGHLEVTTVGVKKFLERGYDVTCAIFAPHEDSHVNEKLSEGETSLELDFDRRIEMMTDFLPARLSNGVRVVIDDVSGRDKETPKQFTQLVTSNLKRFGWIERNLGIICGSDNVTTLESYVTHYNTVCVTRQGHNEVLYSILHRRWLSKALVEGRLVITDRPIGSTLISSSEIRKTLVGVR